MLIFNAKGMPRIMEAPEGKLLIVAWDLEQFPRVVGEIDESQIKEFFGSFDCGTTLFLVLDSGGKLVDMAADPILIKLLANKK